MPGVAGLISRRPAEECLRTVERMIATMRHRPDYVEGMHASADIGVYAAWSAHPGSFAEQASRQTAPGVRLAFSGECWRDGDTSPAGAPHRQGGAGWLVESYRAQGAPFLAHCAGAFSGVLIDEDARSAWIFTDRFPAERIYVHEADDQLFFASEAKAILAVAAETRCFDDRGVADFLAFGSVLQGRTLFRGIASLPGATLLRVDAPARRSARQYFRPADWESLEALSEQALRRKLSDELPGALKRYAGGPGHVGLSLTGGLDTRMILACGIEQDADTVCYTFDGFDGRTLDTRRGERLAAMRGLAHHVLRLDRGFLARFREHVDRTVFVSDGTAGMLAAHEIPLNAQARNLADVRVTGNFGSEIMRTMSTFKPVPIVGDLLADDALQLASQAAAEHEAPDHPVTRAAFAEVPWHLFGTFAAARSQLVVRAPFLDNALVRIAYEAPTATRIGVEATLAAIAACDRVLAAVPTDRGIAWGGSGFVQWLRRAFCAVTFKLDYLDNEGLPRAPRAAEATFDLLRRAGVMGLHKYLPYRRWFRAELAPYAAAALDAAASRRLPYWNGGALRALAQDHVRGTRNRLRELHLVLTLDAVDRTLLRSST